MPAQLLGIGTAVPPYKVDQKHGARFMGDVLRADLPAREAETALAFVDRVFSHARIDERATVLEDFKRASPGEFEFFPKNWRLEPFPTTAARMQRYEREVTPLAERALSAALANAGIEARAVTHLVFSSCTGFYSPGPDIELQRRLGMRAEVHRTLLGFMGCNAGLSGMRVVEQIITAAPRAVVAQVCAELCSLHFQKKPTPELLISNALFADGASAAIYAGAEFGAELGARPLATLQRTHAALTPGGATWMTWRIGDHGFEMGLSPQVPAAIAELLPAFVKEMLAESGSGDATNAGWAIHPGGHRILDAAIAALHLDGDQAASSFEVLRRHGNMSSASILFVLDDLFKRDAERETIFALGFGPGLTIECARFAR